MGFVSASDPDAGDSVYYHITAGNKAGRFTIGGNNGEVLVMGALDHETTLLYTLTVEARDGSENGTATTSFENSVDASSPCHMGTVVTNVVDSPGLARDCETLLAVRYRLSLATCPL